MAFFMNTRQKRAVTYAKAGRCKFAHAALRDEVRSFDRRGSIPDSAFARAAKTVSAICGSALGGAKKAPKRRAATRKGKTAPPQGGRFPWSKYAIERHPYGGYEFLPKRVGAGRFKFPLNRDDVAKKGNLKDVIYYMQMNRDWFSPKKPVFVVGVGSPRTYKNLKDALAAHPKLLQKFVGPMLDYNRMRFDTPEVHERLSI